ncbi:GIY-YIG nuclease family protein [Vibrio cholerae]|uniref:GIY-YIG nuclease family protein n=1 Tax=Vibrio cholerae TaxID=666 RepID=UPI00158197BE|nr:GIY-YIG nuclease family protein [Vibrio cholerae]QKU72399.1 GIY-YIG nuclease family protein [Vibrio cholerae]QKU76354.1 GIY-YIG nuclease family protein [Vibrio cholerae]
MVDKIDIMMRPSNHMNQNRKAKYYYNSIGYKSLTALVEANRDICTVHAVTVRNRLKEGWDIHKALITPKNNKSISFYGEHVVEGVIYHNMPSLAEAYGMKYNTVFKRYSRGCRGDNLIPEKKRKNYVKPLEHKKKPTENLHRFDVAGRSFESQYEACRQLGVKHVTFRKRLSRGQTLAQALGLEEAVDGRTLNTGRKYEVDEQEYTLSQLSQKYGVPSSTIVDRHNRGATIKQAVGLVPLPTLLKQRETRKNTKRDNSVNAFGVTYPSMTACAKAHNMKAYVLYQRVKLSGYSLEEALTMEGKGKSISISGISYKTLTDAASKFKINKETFERRIKAGWTPEQAAGVDNPPNSFLIEYKDKQYSSYDELGIAVGISGRVLYGRVSRSDMTIEEAVDAGERIINAGRWNETILRRNEELGQSKGVLYFVQMLIEGCLIYKIGITSKSVDERLKAEGWPYEIVSIFESTLLDVYLREQELHALLYEKRFQLDGELLDGYTELFDLDDNEVEIVSSLLDEF